MHENVTIWKTHGSTTEETDLKKLQNEELHNAHYSTHTLPRQLNKGDDEIARVCIRPRRYEKYA